LPVGEFAENEGGGLGARAETNKRDQKRQCKNLIVIGRVKLTRSGKPVSLLVELELPRRTKDADIGKNLFGGEREKGNAVSKKSGDS